VVIASELFDKGLGLVMGEVVGGLSRDPLLPFQILAAMMYLFYHLVLIIQFFFFFF